MRAVERVAPQVTADLELERGLAILHPEPELVVDDAQGGYLDDLAGSSREVKCVFSQDGSHYVGHIRQFGVDIGYQAGGVIAWAVFAPTNNVGQGALAGDCGGVSGSAAAGVGVGANVLTGGFQRSFALQPLRVEGTVGLNIAGGIAQISLEYQPRAN